MRPAPGIRGGASPTHAADSPTRAAAGLFGLRPAYSGCGRAYPGCGRAYPGCGRPIGLRPALPRLGQRLPGQRQRGRQHEHRDHDDGREDVPHGAGERDRVDLAAGPPDHGVGQRAEAGDA